MEIWFHCLCFHPPSVWTKEKFNLHQSDSFLFQLSFSRSGKLPYSGKANLQGIFITIVHFGHKGPWLRLSLANLSVIPFSELIHRQGIWRVTMLYKYARASVYVCVRERTYTCLQVKMSWLKWAGKYPNVQIYRSSCDLDWEIFRWPLTNILYVKMTIFKCRLIPRETIEARSLTNPF